MATPKQLLEVIFTWIHQNGAVLIGATLFTSGAAAPFLGLVETACPGVGTTISVAIEITEQFMSCVTMKEVQDLEKQSNKTAEEIQELFKQLKKQFPVREGPSHMMPNQSIFTLQLLLSLAGTLLFVKAAQQFIKETTIIGLKTAVKKSAMAVGGADGMAFALPEATDGCKDQIEKIHMTEACKSLKDTADKILKSIQELREKFTDIKSRFEEVTESQRKQQKTCSESQRDEESYGDNEESDPEDEWSYGDDEESYPEDDESYGDEEESYQEDDESYGEDEESYQEDDENDGEDEESYREDDENDGEDEESYQEDDENDGEDEESYQEDDENDGEDEEQYGEDEESYQEDEEIYGKDEDFDWEDDIYGQDEEFDREDEEIYGQDEEHKKTRKKDEDQKNISSINKARKRKFENNRNPPVALRAGLLNVQSMNNKTAEILDIVTQNNLDVLCTTETWLQRHTAHRVLREASPQNFSFYYQTRPRRGGGVAVQFLNTLQHRRICFNCTVTTFEVVATVLQHDEWDEPVLIINVYRPPGSIMTEFHSFLDEFEELLRHAFENYSSIVVTGDFNVWFDPEIRSYTDEFLWLLPIYDLVQHVRVPTHEAGRTLDLVITRNVEISHLSVRDDRISDHYTVYFNIRPKSKENMDEGEQVKRFKKK